MRATVRPASPFGARTGAALPGEDDRPEPGPGDAPDRSLPGNRRGHAELLRHGWKVNHKRILRLMRADTCVFATAEVHSEDRLETWAAHLPQLSRWHGADRHRSALGGRHRPHPLTSGVHLSGGSAGRFFAALHRLGAGSHAGSPPGSRFLAHGIGPTPA